MTSSIDSKISTIRTYINHPWRQQSLLLDKVRWNKICTSLDVVEDTQNAVKHYTKLAEFKALDGGYLYIYGLLQAFFTQQDAIFHLNQALNGPLLSIKEQYPALYNIRELRTNAIGHPTSRNNDSSFHYISQHSINKHGFTLASYFPKVSKTEISEVNLDQCIADQELLVGRILDVTIEKLEQEWQTHKNQFMSDKLNALIPPNHGYMISKLYEGVWNNYPLAAMNLSSLQESVVEISDGISKRYGSLKAAGIDHEIDKINYLVQKITLWIDNKQLHNNMDAEIFIDCLDLQLQNLYSVVRDIDKRFN